MNDNDDRLVAEPIAARVDSAMTTKRDASEMRKRSVVIAGHRTSVSLENAFWDALRNLAKQRRQTVNQVVTEIDRQRTGNLSSAIRLYILRALQAE